MDQSEARIGRYGGGVFLISLSLTICYFALNILVLYWVLSNINVVGLFVYLFNYICKIGGIAFAYFLNGGPIKGYTCSGVTIEEDIVCQVKAGAYKFYRTIFLTHVLKYVVTFFDTTNFFNICASLWALFSVGKGIFGTTFSYLFSKTRDVAGPTFNFLVWYYQLVFINIENVMHEIKK